MYPGFLTGTLTHTEHRGRRIAQPLAGRPARMTASPEACIGARGHSLTVIRQDNPVLWQETRLLRPKEPQLLPLPSEILLSIIDSARSDKKVLKTFALVCRRLMHASRKFLFANIRLSPEVDLFQILNNRHCTVLPYVQAITIEGSDDAASLMPTYVDDFLVHVPKFTAVTSLHLDTLGSWDLNTIVQAIPPAMQHAIRKLEICRLKGHGTLSALPVLLSNFTALTTLACRKLNGRTEDTFLLTKEEVAPPSFKHNEASHRHSTHPRVVHCAPFRRC
ncbi:hypothetical protein K438DRAFT_770722 [Mycena galopus ATCC 62051]|nr:hypothetical protein K438DRAFT_770722 [Mycena galopus ATCC 62051]